MAGFNGSGTYLRDYDWTTDAADEIPIQADRMDTEMDGFATALSLCILKDGQQTITANIPWAGFKITNLGDATAATDAMNRQAGDARWRLLTGNANPSSSDGAALGTTALQWSDLFLATGGVINWANGDITVTGNSNALAFAGASSGYSFDAALSTSISGTGASMTHTSTDAGASEWTAIILDRFSATPAASDILSSLTFRGRDNAANSTDYAVIRAAILDTTDTSEDGQLQLRALVAGSMTTLGTWGPGLQIGAPTGGDKGAGTINAAASIYVNNSATLVAGNNLSDLGTVATARSNLGYPSSTTDNTVPRFDGTAGAMQTSGVTISDLDNITGARSVAVVNTDTTTSYTARSTDAGAVSFTGILIDRDSASPAASDGLADITFRGNDSNGNNADYGVIDVVIVDPTDGSEDGRIRLRTLVAGTATTGIQVDDSGVTIPVSATLSGTTTTISGRTVHSGKLNLGAGTNTIASGVITYTTPWTTVDTEAAAASDDLDTINGGSSGDLLIIHTTNNGRDVVMKNGTGNILNNTGADVTLTLISDIALYVFDGSNWRGGKLLG